ncbi:hypothetical protein [Streptomyces sp. W4I9-2]|uniref:hypothetical protein n=1 Tax=Streptomyces sp. W4I9-2 TaxID=3042297 RepID=UPI0027855CAF|nr:hypothetical protein [Streptomyces sp. W4I9-2]MDQ0694247.1 hypothetical protein [Streptomyces sp. W4I9-2]
MFGRSTPAERQAAANLLSEVAHSGALTNPGRMSDDDINRQTAAARQLNEAAGGDTDRIAAAIAEVREAAVAAETSR